MLAQLDSFFPPPPITLRAFMMALSAFLTHMQAHTTDDSVRRRLAGFWRALIDASARRRGDARDVAGGSMGGVYRAQAVSWPMRWWTWNTTGPRCCAPALVGSLPAQ
ncbi:hypothetical protein H257_19086 [Aphanomyces astaci]|uniref:Uncharacterized protein n=1 Tax=Aphanomyces astaci TaxID=112090 RepID=W4FAM6_APHAT|nr:hypothetical protein H257_19086 [Aphanomyces astaci]ETV63979.1 hypothetical protein H257_19086 [Aphanomyces astaci]|eukprot:XP_009846538.1 hypothetical protein H257_19086 [Aphanomyces astaci]